MSVIYNGQFYAEAGGLAREIAWQTGDNLATAPESAFAEAAARSSGGRFGRGGGQTAPALDQKLN
jgi:hypothetical protein